VKSSIAVAPPLCRHRYCGRWYGLNGRFDYDGYDEGMYWQTLRAMSAGYSLYGRGSETGHAALIAADLYRTTTPISGLSASHLRCGDGAADTVEQAATLEKG
jgi:hypothetical protein